MLRAVCLSSLCLCVHSLLSAVAVVCLAGAEQEQELASLRAQLTHVSDELVIVEAACGSKAKDRHTLAQITSLEMTR